MNIFPKQVVFIPGKNKYFLNYKQVFFIKTIKNNENKNIYIIREIKKETFFNNYEDSSCLIIKKYNELLKSITF